MIRKKVKFTTWVTSCVASCLLLACDKAAPPSRADARATVEASAREIATTMRRGQIPACGPRDAEWRGHGIILSSDMCYSCSRIGYALRRVGRTLRGFDEPWIVAPQSQVAEVCEYLKRENVPVPVVAVQFDSAFLRAVRSEIVVMDVDSSTDSVEVRSGRFLDELIAASTVEAADSAASVTSTPARPTRTRGDSNDETPTASH